MADAFMSTVSEEDAMDDNAMTDSSPIAGIDLESAVDIAYKDEEVLDDNEPFEVEAAVQQSMTEISHKETYYEDEGKMDIEDLPENAAISMGMVQQKPDENAELKLEENQMMELAPPMLEEMPVFPEEPIQNA